MSRGGPWVLTLCVLGAVVAGAEENGRLEFSRPVPFPHIHGLGYSENGRVLYVPAHVGIRLYDGEGWSEALSHDFMGVAPVAGGFFAGGHPSPGSGLPQPLGLVEVSLDDWSVTVLGLQGQVDLHVLTAGYHSRSLYAAVPSPGGRGVALIRGRDNGSRWEACDSKGVDGTILGLAAHPTDSEGLAMVTDRGLYVSQDGCSSFQRASGQRGLRAAAWVPGGDRILFGGGGLFEYGVAARRVVERGSPRGEVITAIAVSPADTREIAVATEVVSLYLTRDGGQTWTGIVQRGWAQ